MASQQQNQVQNALARQRNGGGQTGVRNYQAGGNYNQSSGGRSYDPNGKAYDPRGYDDGNSTMQPLSDIGLFTITIISAAFGATENFILFDGFQPIEVFNNKGYVPSASTTFTIASNGDLVYTKGGNTVTIHCNELPYYSLVQSSKVEPFHYHHIRYSSLGTPQQSQQLLTLRDQNFLGRSTQNPITPKNYLSSLQFQTLTIDINPLNETVNAEYCIESSILNNENVQLIFFVDSWNQSCMNIQGIANM